MSIALSGNPNDQYNGDGVTVAFSGTFPILASGDVKVVVTSVAGVDADQVLSLIHI